MTDQDGYCRICRTKHGPWGHLPREQGSASYTVAIFFLLAGLAFLAAHVIVWAWTLSSAVGKG